MPMGCFCFKPMTNDNTITLNYKQMLMLKKWLDVPVIKSQNRHRNEFLKVLQPHLDELEVERLAVLKKWAKHSGILGGGIATLPNGQPQFENDSDRKAADDEFMALIAEPIVLTIAKPLALDFAKSFLQKMDNKFNFEDGVVYTEVCDALGIPTEDSTTA